MFYTIYKVTNKTNGKFYVGKHQTKDLNDGYMGSGKLIRRAIEKYGIDSFTKEILEVYDTEQEMNEAEKRLVIISEETYNLCEGGQGGFGYINREIFTTERRIEHNKRVSGFKSFTPEQRLEYGRIGGEASKPALIKRNKENNPFKGKKHSAETKQKIGEKTKGLVPWNKGKPRSDETKQKISLALRKRLES